MKKSATIQARIDPLVKSEAKKILNALHITMSEAISIYLTQVALQKGLPFDIKIPNELTTKTLEKSEVDEDISEVDDIDSFFKDVDK